MRRFAMDLLRVRGNEWNSYSEKTGAQSRFAYGYGKLVN
jgi:hypothetical protein